MSVIKSLTGRFFLENSRSYRGNDDCRSCRHARCREIITKSSATRCRCAVCATRRRSPTPGRNSPKSAPTGPPPLKIRLFKPHGKKQPGHVLTHDYHEPVTLINAGVAEQAR